MCKKCEEIDARINNYKQQLHDVDDQTAIVLLDLAIANLESEKTDLHPKPEK